MKLGFTAEQYERYLKNRGRYPGNWKDIVAEIRVRAGNRCECMGECGLHRTNPGPRRCVEMNHAPARWAQGTVVMTVAHLCHNPKCARRSHLRLMCNRCHLRYDLPLHKANAARTRDGRRGQARLFEVSP
jgi:hypothetical protein